MGSHKSEEFSQKETAKRRDAALFRALNTPPKPHKPAKRAKKTPPKRG